MKTFNLDWIGKGTKPCRRMGLMALLSVLTLSMPASVLGQVFGQSTVATLTDANHGTPGYKDGNTFSIAQFRFPAGLALTPAGDTMFVADCSNNAVRMVTQIGDTANSYTVSAFTNKNGIIRPVDVAIDSNTNIYVLNHGKTGKDGTILEFNGNSYLNYNLRQLIATNAYNLTNATAITLDDQANIYATIQSNTVIRITGNSTVVVGVITNSGTSLRGIVMRQDGRLALTDAGNNGIWLMDPSNTNVFANATKFTGFMGAGDVLGPPGSAAFNRPEKIAKAGNNYLVVADFNNHKVKVIEPSGTVDRLFGVSSTYWSGTYKGWRDGTVNSLESIDPVQSRYPCAVTVGANGTVYDTENYYHLLRMATSTGLPALPSPPPGTPTILSAITNIGQVKLTWSSISAAVSYNLKRSTSTNGSFTIIANTTSTSYTDTTVSGGTTYYYVVSALNSDGVESPNSAWVSVTTPLPPVPDPVIGYVIFDNTGSNSIFYPASSAIFNNDAVIVIQETNGAQAFYEYGATPLTTNAGSINDPTTNSFTAPTGYKDGLDIASVTTKYSVFPPQQTLPDFTIKAVGTKNDGSPNSSIVSARFQFVAGNPSIDGNNAAQFTINDVTKGAQFLYTTDGSDPRTSSNATVVGPISGSSGLSLSLAFPSNTNTILFQIAAFKANYQTSSVVPRVFSSSNFVANAISFGFASGEASSDFVAAPGQTFYAPVTLTTLPGTKIYSLQFNITVTNGGAATNIGPAVASGAFSFQSMLMKPIVPVPTNYPAGFQLYTPILPMMFAGGGFTNLEFVNTNMNLLGVGWVERYSQTNLYDTLSQTLTTYSLAHDDLFPNPLQPNGVIVGGYGFQIPPNAQAGHQYQIQIGRPSATDDGVGAPGSSIYIASPYNTNSSALAGGSLNALKVVTVGQRKYVAGDVYPFRWYNAGDFGDTNLDNADVEQVFQSAVYQLNYPPFDSNSGSSATGYTNVSDFYDAMDSCGYTYVDNGNGYLEKNTAVANTDVLFNGNDSTINQVAFGDGKLDVCDVYVTYRRSLDTSLTWFRRFWTNGVRVAEATNYMVTPQSVASMPLAQSQIQSASTSTNPPQVNFTAGDIIGSAGQTVQVPIIASIYGNYPLRVLMLNLTVEPLDGSPALETPIQFVQTSSLGTPYTTEARGNANYSIVWLNSTITGLTGTVTIGTLGVTIPANAPTNAAYAVHFDHASASPNGLASFPRQVLTGLITLASHTNSSYGDGIPDSWRLRWFGTVNNYLSTSNACPSGDGVNNWMKYVAGVDPNTANDFPSLRTKTTIPTGYTASIHWPSVSGKQYVIERSSSLYAESWALVTTNTGTGSDMEFNDTNTSPTKFYRVRILQ